MTESNKVSTLDLDDSQLTRKLMVLSLASEPEAVDDEDDGTDPYNSGYARIAKRQAGTARG
ncbi:MAG: hypothetical protein OEW35_10310 [Gammaproteobacteria bacterium]|nr:hypothetical protein [Gammaproteobacteria bacterium]MDH4254267.1 hypothetical protein [Gammaproteobacteria bacterium]MDH5311113.1 hypothetical protein [Gammaproteobacteria bacterium]